MLGLDRKKMEEDRLARIVAKRKRDGSISPPPLKREKSSVDESSIKPSSMHRIPLIGTPSDVIDLTDDTPILQFPKGTIRRTWSTYHPRGNDIKIEEVLQKEILKTAVFSSYLWDSDWLFTKINLTQTKMIFIKGACSGDIMRKEEAIANEMGIKMCFANLSQGRYSSMHSKLMLLFYGKYLRIVIPSANLMPYDWGETGVMENTVFLIDLPRHADGKARSKEALTFFGQELYYFLERIGLWEKAREGILNFDFSATENLAFIHTVSGTHWGGDMHRTGFVGLGGAIRRLGLESDDLQLDYTSASIGCLDQDTIGYFYHSCRGTKPDLSALKKQESSAIGRKFFNILFPTRDTVRHSLGGPSGAGTICIYRKWWENPDFPRSMFRDYQSVREGLLSHNKTLLARGVNASGQISWAYVGSANMSPSAWGKLSRDPKRKAERLTCANWECGVLVAGNSKQPTEEWRKESLHNAFEGVLDVPFKEPAKHYADDTEPWFFDEN